MECISCVRGAKAKDRGGAEMSRCVREPDNSGLSFPNSNARSGRELVRQSACAVDAMVRPVAFRNGIAREIDVFSRPVGHPARADPGTTYLVDIFRLAAASNPKHKTSSIAA